MNAATSGMILDCTHCATPMPWGWAVTTIYGAYCRPSCEAQHRADVLVAQMGTLNAAADVARSFGHVETAQHIVDLMINLEDDYYDAGHDPNAYNQARIRGAK